MNSDDKAFIAVVCKPEKSASECIEKRLFAGSFCLEIGIDDYEIFMHRLLDKHFSDQVSSSVTLFSMFSLEGIEIHTKQCCLQSIHLILLLRD